MASRLKLPICTVDIPVEGSCSMFTAIKSSTVATIRSRFNQFEKRLKFLLVPNVASALPTVSLKRELFKIPENIQLADPEFHTRSEIDALLGVELFYKLLCSKQIRIKDHDAILQKTHLGWIVAGRIYIKGSIPGKVSCHFVQTASGTGSDELTRFWEIEPLPLKKHYSAEEQACETHFTDKTIRDSTGRYVISLPFNENKDKLGDSYRMALRRFNSLENKFAKNPALKESYSSFMQEYVDMDHMSEALDNASTNTGFFLPHHAVVKSDGLTTKTRVVFDGSAKSSSGFSLNDTLMVGPTIQDNRFSIYTRFRSFPFALTADVEKMYRQIRVASEDCVYQRILWRENKNVPIKIYDLKTVTYGTASEPFLATRVLSQLAQDEGHAHPLAATVLMRDFYVDDLLSGASTFEEASALRDDLIQLVQKGGLTLRKWASNDPRLISDLSVESETELMSLDSTDTIKTLGLYWSPKDDKIVYKINDNAEIPDDRITKRKMLAEIARLFDPLGLLVPVIAYAKILIQVQSVWLEFEAQLPLLNMIKFDRCMVASDSIEIQLHGFADASEKGYGACIFIRYTDKQGKHQVILVCSKSRVAPVQTITLPRLELCAALLLAQLYAATLQSLEHLNFQKTVFWSDSTVSLHWIKTSPHSLKTFVSNRVAQIQELTQPHEWRHVPTQDNPADSISRGQLPKDFMGSPLWQHGPHWLSQNGNFWPQLEIKSVEVPEWRKAAPPQVSMKLTSEQSDLYGHCHIR